MENQMNETMQPEEKLTWKERKQRWKAAQKARKAEKREYYRNAPALKRWWALYLWKPFVAILVLAVLISTLYKPIGNFVSNVVVLQALDARNRPLSEEDIPKIYELAPLDEDGAARVAAVFKRELPLLKDSITGALDAPFCSGVSDLSNNLCKLRIAMKCEASKQFAARAELLRGLKLIAERNSICLSGKQIDVLELDEAPEAGAQAGLPVHQDSSGSSGDPAPAN